MCINPSHNPLLRVYSSKQFSQTCLARYTLSLFSHSFAFYDYVYLSAIVIQSNLNAISHIRIGNKVKSKRPRDAFIPLQDIGVLSLLKFDSIAYQLSRMKIQAILCILFQEFN